MVYTQAGLDSLVECLRTVYNGMPAVLDAADIIECIDPSMLGVWRNDPPEFDTDKDCLVVMNEKYNHD
jgi:hypothetical protein